MRALELIQRVRDFPEVFLVASVSDGVSKWVDMRYTPMAGYMEAEAVVVMMKPYSAYASV